MVPALIALSVLLVGLSGLVISQRRKLSGLRDLLDLTEHRAAADLAFRKSEIDQIQAKLSESHDSLHTAKGRASELSNETQALWLLEITRSERTWRHSVAPSPESENPFSFTDDSLRLAVEIEAAALREDVGAFTSVLWKADPVEEPIRMHRVLRVAQELLSEAARDPRPVELVVTSESDATVLELVYPDSSEIPVEIDAPLSSSNTIDVRTGPGLVVVVS